MAVSLGSSAVDRVPDRADQRDLDPDPAADPLAPHVDLDDGNPFRQEGPIGEVGAEHHQGVAVFHRPVPGTEADQPGHAHVVGVVVLDELLAAERVQDRGPQRPCELHELIVRAGAARAGEDGHPARLVQHLGGVRQRLVVRHDHGRDGPDGGRPRAGRRVVEEHLARHHDHRDAVPLQGGAHRHLQHPGKLGGHADQLTVDAALTEQLLRVRLLEILPADLLRRDMRGDREHRHPAAVGVVQAVNKVQVARSAAARAHRELARQRRLRRGGERRGFLVPDMGPGDIAVPAQGVGEPVQRVPWYPVHPAHARRLQRRHHDIGDRGCHALGIGDDATLRNGPPRVISRRPLRPCLVYDVERGLRDAAEAGEAAAVTTSRIRASPAWAPSARPTSWDSDAGVHSSVEKP